MSDIIYTPTQWVDNTEPSINADNLNHIEQGILAATNAARSASNAISDAFSTEKSYAAGDYCIYLNSLYKFTTAKAAGPWDGTAVVPTTISGELNSLNDDMGWKFAGQAIGKSEAVNFMYGWKEAIAIVIPYFNQAGIRTYSILILKNFFDFVGSSGAITVEVLNTKTNDLQYVLRVAFRESYIRLDTTIWNSQDAGSETKLAVWCR